MTTPEAVAEKLKGTLKKFTVDVYLKDGRHIEYQSDDPIRIDFDIMARDTFLAFGYSVENMVKMSEIAAWKTTPNMNTE